MKKIISFTLAFVIIISMCLTLCSCGKTAECDYCGEECKVSKMHESEVWGETIYSCKDCYKEMMDFFN